MGEDVTEAFLAELPSHDGDELITKDFLRAELAELRHETVVQIASVRSEVADVRNDMQRLHNQTMATLIGIAGVITALITVVG